ncbi:MAG: pyrroline-5-carboxylate reductase [Pseudomonadota bacterium]
MLTDAFPLLLVGCGKMGGAMLAGWLGQGIEADKIVVVEPAEATAEAIAADHGVAVVGDAGDVPTGFAPSVIVLAVKPQVMADAVAGLGRFADAGALVLSIAAGTTIGVFERALGDSIAIVRLMPNTPAAVGHGITALVANRHATDAQRAAADALAATVGETVWLDDEALMDAVTGLSGSGPAYVFLLIEILANAGVANGLPPDIAGRLASATVEGAGQLARLSDQSPEELRRAVTSPGGTTAEALEVLMAEDGLQPLFDRAVAAATRRSKELAS